MRLSYRFICIKLALNSNHHRDTVDLLGFVRSPSLARDMAKIAFTSVAQTSTLKLAFVVEYMPLIGLLFL
jgi:hypothetical protein